MKFNVKIIFILIVNLFFFNCVTDEDTQLILNNLDKNKTYTILIANYPGIMDMAKLVGLNGDYGHIELIYNGYVYGARPKTCKKLIFTKFIEQYNGLKYEIYEIKIPGDFKSALDYYDNEVEGKPYDLYYRSCTSIINSMYKISSGNNVPLSPIDVEYLYSNDDKVRKYMDEKNLDIPSMDVWLPDQFIKFGTYITSGVFNN